MPWMCFKIIRGGGKDGEKDRDEIRLSWWLLELSDGDVGLCYTALSIFVYI